MFTAVPAHQGPHLTHIRNLFQEYEASLAFDLSFQDFEQELRTLPGEYAPPQGRLLLAYLDSTAAGCVALRKISNRICEMKRLYVRPSMRRLGVGKFLALKIIAEAQKAGYQWMRLDTMPSMKTAFALYESLGFETIAPYRSNPIPGAKFLQLDLERHTDAIRHRQSS